MWAASLAWIFFRPNPNEISGDIKDLLSPVFRLLSPVSCATHSLALDASESVPINGFLEATVHISTIAQDRETYKATSTTPLVR